MKKIKVIKIKPMRGIYDSDWDGVPNDQDCQWWNPNKQDDEDNETMYERNRKALKKSKYFDYRGAGYSHQEAMQKAQEYVDEVMPLIR